MFENFSILEGIWSLVALVGASYSLLNIKDGIYDLALLDIANGESERITAKGNIRRDTIRFGIQFMYLVLGIWAGFLPNSTNPSRELVAFGFSLVFILASLGLTASAFYDHQDRQRLVALAKTKEVITEIKEHLHLD